MLPRSIHPNRQRILTVLERKVPLSDRAIAAIAYVSHRSVKEYLRGLKATNEAHICAWVKNSPGSPTGLWMIGPGEDAERPAPLTARERRRRDREKEGVKEAEAARKRADRRINKTKGRSLTSILLGV